MTKADAMRTRGGVDTSNYIRRKVPFCTYLVMFISICKLLSSYFVVCGGDFHFSNVLQFFFFMELLSGHLKTFPLEMEGGGR